MGGKKRKAAPTASQPLFPPEERRAEVATVGWMLCALTASVAESLVLILQVLRNRAGWTDDIALRLELLQAIVTFMAIVTGAIGLSLTTLIYRWRKTYPPSSITMFVLIVCVLPFITLAVHWLR